MKQKKLTLTEREDSYIAQTKEGAKKAMFSIKARHGEDFYKIIGSKGGKVGGLKGFALDRERAREAGRKGGSVSRRKKTQ